MRSWERNFLDTLRLLNLYHKHKLHCQNHGRRKLIVWSSVVKWRRFLVLTSLKLQYLHLVFRWFTSKWHPITSVNRSPPSWISCVQYPSIKFLKVDVEESPAVAKAESIKSVPTFKIYKNGDKVNYSQIFSNLIFKKSHSQIILQNSNFQNFHSWIIFQNFNFHI